MSRPQTPQDRQRGWVIGHVAGAPVVLAPSSLLAAVVLTLMFAPSLSGLGSRSYVVAAAFVVLLFGSVLIHELAHGLVARRRGQQPRAFVLTLWGGHTTFDGPDPGPGTTALVAVVGPVANLVLALVFLGLAAIAPVGSLGEWLMYSGAVSNGFVGAFNLVPGLPLDGGRILAAAVWAVTKDRHTGSVVAGWTGRVVAAGTLLVAIGLPLASGGTPSLFTVVWAALIAAFLWTGASESIASGSRGRQVDSLTVAGVGRPAVGVPYDTTVLAAGLRAREVGAVDVVLLSPEGRPAAFVDLAAAASVPADAVATTPVQAVSVPLPFGAVIDAHARGHALLQAVAAAAGGAGAGSAVVALDDGMVVALVRVGDVLAAVRG
ncbi:MAG: peptidase M50 [Actinobacteria bacterium]|nr:peptidase M50 [Actinomycetota bacterium]MCG2802222.1 peptidase M50 [Cellulomonas sp.]